jgi:predicted thioredoxin/glutaredoxin
MKKYLITLTIILATLWFSLTSFMNSVKANEYNKAVIGHVIQSTVNDTNVDVSKLMEQELEKIAHQFALESISIIQQYLPTILDGVLTEMRLKADSEYKCALLKGSKIEDKECE